MANDKPLVSLCITCYNQARYIREAVQSAFDQTYDPLEIVICDDCSTDGTAEIVEKMVDGYKASDGRHRVVFKRNEANLGILKNYEQCFKLGHGELLVTGAGDDIQKPNRVERTVGEWLRDGKRAGMISCAWQIIDESGHVQGSSGPWPKQTPLGAATAYVKAIVTVFDDLPQSRIAYEDHIFSARALLLGPELRIHEPLFSYRYGSGQSTIRHFRTHRFRIDRHALDSLEILNADMIVAKNRLPSAYYGDVESMINWRRGRFLPEYKLMGGNTMLERWHGFMAMRPEFGWDLSWHTKLFYYAPNVLPFHIGDWVTASYENYCRVKGRLARIGWLRRLLGKKPLEDLKGQLT